MVIRKATSSTSSPAAPAPVGPSSDTSGSASPIPGSASGSATSILAAAVPTVSEFTRMVADTIEGRFAEVVVQGEISGWNRAASGHTYFNLRDDRATLCAVLWRSRSVPFPVKDGMKVIAAGRLTLYPPRGQYQLDCESLLPIGAGELQLAFEQLKARLQAEGLFDGARKKPLPDHPRRIGVVTSRTGAAVRDIVTTLRRRMPTVEVVIRPALVQGNGAAQDVALAIRQFNEHGKVDLLIVGRGGGSAEDLWAFNEEAVARAIADSTIPVISAVGHEIDFTIADFVADVRAATPTAAAELAVRDRGELVGYLVDAEERLNMEIEEKIAACRQELSSLLRSRGFSRPLDMVMAAEQRLDDLTHRSGMALRSVVERTSQRLEILRSTLEALNPDNVISRGYASIERDGRPVRRIGDLATDDLVEICMRDGKREARILPEKDEPTNNE